jgi:hypothetical protein
MIARRTGISLQCTRPPKPPAFSARDLLDIHGSCRCNFVFSARPAMQTRVAPVADAEPACAVTELELAAIDSDPWSQTLRLLDTLRARAQQESVHEPARRPAKPATDAAPASGARHRAAPVCEASKRGEVCATVTLIERLSATHVVLRWCSCTCHYGDQTWVCGVARATGVCAVTGHLIRRGDAVYRPQNRSRLPPVNANAMIHPSAFV